MSASEMTVAGWRCSSGRREDSGLGLGLAGLGLGLVLVLGLREMRVPRLLHFNATIAATFKSVVQHAPSPVRRALLNATLPRYIRPK